MTFAKGKIIQSRKNVKKLSKKVGKMCEISIEKVGKMCENGIEKAGKMCYI